MTSETLTGAVMPTQGLISTLPSIRGLDGQSMGPHEQGAESARRRYRRALTMVAEIPGYPIRKFPFAGPDTRTKAAISNQLCLSHHRHGRLVKLWGICEWMDHRS